MRKKPKTLTALFLAAVMSMPASGSFISSAEVTADPGTSSSDIAGKVVISEVMPKNRAVIDDGSGTFPDWVELTNISGESIDLNGCSLSQKNMSLTLEGSIVAGERRVVFVSSSGSDESATGNKLTDKARLELLDGTGNSIYCVDIPELGKNESFSLINNEGTYASTMFATPGYANTNEGYIEFQNSQSVSSPLIISEVVVYNTTYLKQQGIKHDWIELKNVSHQEINLAEYSISKDSSGAGAFPLPDRILAPGEFVILDCNFYDQGSAAIVINFSLSADSESLFLLHYGSVVDYLALHDIQPGDSCGRINGENGVWYFTSPTQWQDNYGEYRTISSAPEFSVKGGQYETDALSIELSAQGTIYYTLDGTAPATDSYIYSGPIRISETTVVRAIAIEDGRRPSKSVTENYIMNQGHTIPVVCINADSTRDFGYMWQNSIKFYEISGNMSYYSENGSFSENVSIEMNGDTSLDMVKKNLKVNFSTGFGCSEVDFDIFGDGVTDFSSLIIRAGQDYYNAVIRNELAQTLCAEYSDDVLTQRGQWVSVYINGKYYGIYALKENGNKPLYATRYGVDKDSVSVDKASLQPGWATYKALDFMDQNDITVPENYVYLCEKLLDINSFIDWLVVEGWSCNPDLTNGNLKYACSTQDDGKVRLIFYDLDSGLSRTAFAFTNVLNPSIPNQVSCYAKKLLENPDFRAQFLQRVSDALHGAFSDENVVATIDSMYNEIAGEMQKDCRRWGLRSFYEWESSLNELRKKMSSYNSVVIEQLDINIHLTQEELQLYFGDLI